LCAELRSLESGKREKLWETGGWMKVVELNKLGTNSLAR
jgi:hypothetical protein